MKPRSIFGAILSSLGRRGGFVLIQPETKFGINPLVDAKVLSSVRNLPMDCIFDVGANDGRTALQLLVHFPVVPVVSFEPHPTTYAQLKLRLGSSPNFTAENLALGSVQGTVEMFVYDKSVLNSLIPNAPYAVRFSKQASRILVDCTTIDAYCDSHGIDRVGLLKIDTEGFDLEVLQGARQMLSRKAVSLIYVEFNTLQPQEKASGGALVPIDAFLSPFGYRFFSSYLDHAFTEDALFTVSNALFIAA